MLQKTMSTSPDSTPFPLDHLAELAGRGGYGDAPALLLRDELLNHDALNLRVDHLAGWLAREVREPGARVATWAAKGELTCLMPLAAARAGLVHVPINPLLKRAQAAHILADSGSVMLIANAARLASLEPGDFTGAAHEEGAALDAAYSAAIARGPSQADPNDLTAILYTSGSTG